MTVVIFGLHGPPWYVALRWFQWLHLTLCNLPMYQEEAVIGLSFHCLSGASPPIGSGAGHSAASSTLCRVIDEGE